jgi:hypothetical protein
MRLQKTNKHTISIDQSKGWVILDMETTSAKNEYRKKMRREKCKVRELSTRTNTPRCKFCNARPIGRQSCIEPLIVLVTPV